MALIMTILVNVMINAILMMTVVQIMEISVQDQVILVEAFKILLFSLSPQFTVNQLILHTISQAAENPPNFTHKIRETC